MRITIEIDANHLKEIQKLTGLEKKSPAVVEALSRFLREQKRQRFIERALSGQTDFALTNDELEARDAHFATIRRVAGSRLRLEPV
ncbi:MAG: type II toxin-antitoxin system VapB family antitoxin [Limisphaerales bacterium]